MIPKSFRDIVDMSFVLYDEPTAGKFADRAYTNLIDTALYSGYIDICRKSRCAPGKFELATVPGQAEYDYPPGCLIVRTIRWRGNAGLKLERVSPNHIIRLVQGEPEAYYTTPDKIGIYKVPCQHYVLDIDGYKGPEGPFADREEEPHLIPLQYRIVLAYYLCKEYARVDKSAAKVEPGVFDKWWGTYKNALEEMAETLHEGRNDDQYIGVM